MQENFKFWNDDCCWQTNRRTLNTNFGVNKVNSLGTMAAFVKHEYYANFTICCHLKISTKTIIFFVNMDFQ